MSLRIGPDLAPEVDDFGKAILRARIQLSQDAEADANTTSPSVGEFHIDGGEVRVKIDF